jgi:hypothetical protein
MSLIKDKITTTETQGASAVSEAEEVEGRCVAYPWVRYMDVWVEDKTNKRYQINHVTPISSYKQVPLIYAIKMSKIEYSDVMYTPAADAKVLVKDLYDSALVNYTPQVEAELEESAMNQWKDDFDDNN